MRCTKLIFLLLIVTLSGCECDERLSRVCPTPVECWIEQGLENNEQNLITEGFPYDAEVGACQLGTTDCDEEGNLFCDGVVYPTDETCNFVDDDCDHDVDEGFDEDHDGYTVCNGDCDDRDKHRAPNLIEACDGKDNDCKDGVPANETNDHDGDGTVECADCDDWDNTRSPELLELCDGVDNDCDGEVDENAVEAWDYCGVDTTGACTRERPICIDGESYCPAVFPTPEGCDNIDNDCDGAVDEDLIRECSSICGTGIEFCLSGVWDACNAPQPTLEICDGFDNDCDGEIDEGCLCQPGTIELCMGAVFDEEGNAINCGVGVKECLEDGSYTPCVWVTNQPEVCNNYDDDCDGEIDLIQQTCGDPEFAGVGECVLGTQTCVEGIWQECEGNVEPLEEVCDEKDNDCDGEIDENLNSHEKVDMVFMIDGSGSMCSYVNAIAQGLDQYVSDFEDSEHRFALVMFPGEYNQVGGNIPWIVITDLVDVNQFIAILNSVSCTYPSVENSYDAMYDLADPTNPALISWRADAYPYLVLATDEPAQSWAGNTESSVAAMTSNCQVGECVSGDSFETYVITNPGHFQQWDEVVFGDYGRLVNIDPADANEYANKLRNIFTNVCL